MKKIFLTCAVLMLSSCALYDAYTMTHFDNSEYQLITRVRAEADQYKNECDDPIKSKVNANQIEFDTKVFMLYSEHIPHNDRLISASKSLHEIAKGLSDQYAKSDKVSPAFCKIKFNSLDTAATQIQTVTGRRPR
jgi:hypothetical protein